MTNNIADNIYASMATLRSGKRLDAADNNNEVVEDKKKHPVKDRTTLIVFFGLLIDLLAFTLILPLFPALISHYRENDSSGLFAAAERKVALNSLLKISL